jgi:predicted ferric reductase
MVQTHPQNNMGLGAGLWRQRWALGSLAVHAAFFAAGIQLVSTTYADNGGTLDANAVGGVVLWLVGIFAGPASIALALVALAQQRTKLGGTRATIEALVMSIIAVAFVAWAAIVLVQPTKTFFVSPQPDTLKQLLGGMVIATYLPVVAAGTFFAGELILGERLPVEVKPGAPLPPHQPDSFVANVRGLVGGILTLAGTFFAACTLTCIWNFSATSYFPYDSTYSLVSGVVWQLGPNPSVSEAAAGWTPPIILPKVYPDVVVYFALLFCWVILGAAGTYTPSVRRSLHRRFAVPYLPSFLNLFPLGCTRGEALLLASFVGLNGYWFWYWSTGYPRIMAEGQGYDDKYPLLHGYARVMGHMTTLSMSFLTFPVARNSVWEAAFGVPFDRAVKYHRALGRLTWLLVTVHLSLWLIKWSLEGTLRANITTIDNLQVTALDPNDPNTEGGTHGDNWTIVVVEIAWILLTVALLVATFLRRWNYELFQYTHVFALLFMFAAIVHAWSHWYYTAAGLLLFVFDKVIRTVNTARPVDVLSLSHADGITRVVVRATALGPRGFYAGQYAWLCVPSISPFQWHPFTISSSPSKAALEATAEFHIKDMGEGTWTGKLAAQALALTGKPEGDQEGLLPSSAPALVMSIDGPYGRTGHYYESTVLLLIAGGIGITPMHAILQDLLLRASEVGTREAAKHEGPSAARLPLGRVQRVHLVWAVRDERLPQAFADTLLGLLELDKGASSPFPGGVTLDIHLTEGGQGSGKGKGKALAKAQSFAGKEAALLLSGEDEDLALPGSSSLPTPVEAGWTSPEEAKALTALIQRGRPDLTAVFAAAAAEAARLSPAEAADVRAHAAVCGPQGMIDAASRHAFETGMGFHSEVFHF